MFKPIGRIVKQKTATGLARSISAAVVVTKATTTAAGRFEAVRFRNGRLTIVAPSLMAAQDLALQKEQIIIELNTAFGDHIVKDLFVRS